MTQNEINSMRRHNSYLIAIIMVGLFLVTGFCSVTLDVATLLVYIIWRYTEINSLIPVSRLVNLSLYIPQIGTFLLLVVTIIFILKAIKKHKLGSLKTYTPLIMLVIFCAVMFASSRVIVYGYAIPTKVTNPENRLWSEAMVSRAFGYYGIGLLDACVLSDKVVALIDVWSVITPDNRMPVLTWAENSFPDSSLPGNPVSCKNLEKNWYLCYMGKPYQLVHNQDGMCDFRIKDQN
jgi:hypothetical protein